MRSKKFIAVALIFVIAVSVFAVALSACDDETPKSDAVITPADGITNYQWLYDGEAHKVPQATLNHSETQLVYSIGGETIDIDTYTVTDIGVYTITVSAAETENYKAAQDVIITVRIVDPASDMVSDIVSTVASADFSQAAYISFGGGLSYTRGTQTDSVSVSAQGKIDGANTEFWLQLTGGGDKQVTLRIKDGWFYFSKQGGEDVAVNVKSDISGLLAAPAAQADLADTSSAIIDTILGVLFNNGGASEGAYLQSDPNNENKYVGKTNAATVADRLQGMSIVLEPVLLPYLQFSDGSFMQVGDEDVDFDYILGLLRDSQAQIDFSVDTTDNKLDAQANASFVLKEQTHSVALTVTDLYTTNDPIDITGNAGLDTSAYDEVNLLNLEVNGSATVHESGTGEQDYTYDIRANVNVEPLIGLINGTSTLQEALADIGSLYIGVDSVRGSGADYAYARVVYDSAQGDNIYVFVKLDVLNVPLNMTFSLDALTDYLAPSGEGGEGGEGGATNNDTLLSAIELLLNAIAQQNNIAENGVTVSSELVSGLLALISADIANVNILGNSITDLLFNKGTGVSVKVDNISYGTLAGYNAYEEISGELKYFDAQGGSEQDVKIVESISLNEDVTITVPTGVDVLSYINEKYPRSFTASYTNGEKSDRIFDPWVASVVKVDYDANSFEQQTATLYVQTSGWTDTAFLTEILYDYGIPSGLMKVQVPLQLVSTENGTLSTDTLNMLVGDSLFTDGALEGVTATVAGIEGNVTIYDELVTVPKGMLDENGAITAVGEYTLTVAGMGDITIRAVDYAYNADAVVMPGDNAATAFAPVITLPDGTTQNAQVISVTGGSGSIMDDEGNITSVGGFNESITVVFGYEDYAQMRVTATATLPEGTEYTLSIYNSFGFPAVGNAFSGNWLTLVDLINGGTYVTLQWDDAAKTYVAGSYVTENTIPVTLQMFRGEEDVTSEYISATDGTVLKGASAVDNITFRVTVTDTDVYDELPYENYDIQFGWAQGAEQPTLTAGTDTFDSALSGKIQLTVNGTPYYLVSDGEGGIAISTSSSAVENELEATLQIQYGESYTDISVADFMTFASGGGNYSVRVTGIYGAADSDWLNITVTGDVASVEITLDVAPVAPGETLSGKISFVYDGITYYIFGVDPFGGALPGYEQVILSNDKDNPSAGTDGVFDGTFSVSEKTYFFTGLEEGSYTLTISDIKLTSGTEVVLTNGELSIAVKEPYYSVEWKTDSITAGTAVSYLADVKVGEKTYYLGIDANGALVLSESSDAIVETSDSLTLGGTLYYSFTLTDSEGGSVELSSVPTSGFTAGDYTITITMLSDFAASSETPMQNVTHTFSVA